MERKDEQRPERDRKDQTPQEHDGHEDAMHVTVQEGDPAVLQGYDPWAE